MPPPRHWDARASEREQRFAAARSQYEAQRLLEQWREEDERRGLDADTFGAMNARLMRLEANRDADLSDLLADGIGAALADLLPKHVREQLEAQLPALLARAAEVITRPLEARLKALEQKQVVFRGTHQAGAMYQAGDLAIRQGGLWLCRKDTVSPPGTDPDSWTLAVKKGAVSG